MATEAKRLVDLLSQKDTDVFPEYSRCNKIRECTATVLVKLEQEFACKATGAAANNTSERVTDLSDSMGGSSNKDMNNSKWKLNCNQAAEGKSKKDKRKLKKRTFRKQFQYGRSEEVEKSLYEIAESSAATIRQLEDKVNKMSHLADDGLDKIHGGFDLTKDEVKSLLESIKETAYTTD